MFYMQLSNDRRYRLNLDKIIQYFTVSQTDKSTQSDITELYRQGFQDMELIQKQINTTNVKNGQLSVQDQYRYDIIKGMLEVLFSTGSFSEGNGVFTKHREIDSNISISECIVWNTLISYGFLEEILEGTE